MDISKTFLEEVLRNTSGLKGEVYISGFQLGDEEFVTVLEFEQRNEIILFMATLVMALAEKEKPVGVMAALSGVELVPWRGTRANLRFRGWRLTP